MAGTLVICRSLAGAGHLRRLGASTPIVVASDDPRVHAETSAWPGVESTCFLEELAAFYTVTSDVKACVGRIDAWLEEIARGSGLPAGLLAWGCTVEGGFTSQRIQDTLLLINSYEALLDRVRPREIAVISDPTALWEDHVLNLVARHRGVPLRSLGRGAWAIRFARLAAYLRPPGIALYHLIHLLRSGGGRRLRPPGPCDAADSNLFFLLSSAGKHVDNIRQPMAGLQAAGSRALALCWSSSDRMGARHAADQLGEAGLDAVRLERWTTCQDILAGLRRAWRARRAAERSLPQLDVTHHGIRMEPILAECLRHFFIVTVPFRFRFQRALRAALRDRRPSAVKPWGAPEGFEYREISALWGDSHRPTVFQYWLGVGLPWPYSDPRSRLDFFLAKDRREAEQVRGEYGLPPESVEIVGQARFAGHRAHADKNPADVSRARIGLPRDRALYIGFDPNCALRGYQSAREQAAITRALLEALRRAPGLFMVIKPHPAYPIDHLIPLLAEHMPERLAVLPRHASLLDFLNSVDIVVSKYSSLLLEAALMRKVALASLFDGENRFRILGPMVEAVTDGPALTALLTGLAADPARWKRWRRERLDEQERILATDYPMLSGPGAVDRTAAAITFQAERHRSH